MPSVKANLASGIKSAIVTALSGSGFTSSNVFVHKRARNRPQIALGIKIVPNGMVPGWYSNERDKNAYRFKITAFKSGNEDLGTSVEAVPDMIETIQKLFHGKAVSGVTESCFCEAGPSTDFASSEFPEGWEVCSFVLTAYALEAN